MLTIFLKNGDYRCYSPIDYTNYEYTGNVFIVYQKERIIGIYNIYEVISIEYRKV